VGVVETSVRTGPPRGGGGGGFCAYYPVWRI